MLNKLLAFITILLTTLFATACESDSDSNDADAQLRCEQSDAEPCEEDQGGEESDPVAGEDQPLAGNPDPVDAGEEVSSGTEAGTEVVAGEDVPTEAGTDLDCSDNNDSDEEREEGCVEPEPQID